MLYLSSAPRDKQKPEPKFPNIALLHIDIRVCVYGLVNPKLVLGIVMILILALVLNLLLVFLVRSCCSLV